jgi:hypothetical protein
MPKDGLYMNLEGMLVAYKEEGKTESIAQGNTCRVDVIRQMLHSGVS